MKILVPVDHSKYTQVALEFIASKGANFGQNPCFYLVHVHAPSFFETLTGGAKAAEEIKLEAMALLEGAAEQLRSVGLKVETVFEVGPVAQTIDRIAEEEKVDLIVMGSQGTSAINGIIFGSVTNSLLAITYEPMLILRDRPVTLKDSPYIAIALDASIYAETAVQFLADHMMMFGGTPRVYMINVAERPAPGNDYPLEDAVKHKYKKLVGVVFDEAEEKFKAAGAEVRRVNLVSDEPGDAISEFADQEDIDLIVIGTRGQGSFRASVMGSTATRVASVSDKPLLIVQTDEDEIQD